MMNNMLPELDPRKRFDLVKDPVHGYIPFTSTKLLGDDEKTEADLINSEWVQRLRRIHQLQSAWVVYPGADHNRFSHALGTMHLAGQFARAVYTPLYNLYKEMPWARFEDIEYVVETFRVAGLLHDIGHGPFSHLLDNCFLLPRYKITHENIGAKIIIEELGPIIQKIRRSPEGIFEKSIDPEIVANLICTNGEEKLEFPWRSLYQIIRGGYDADKMDFILRDSLMCGQRGLSLFDIHRLMYTSLVLPNGAFALHKSSLPTLKTFLMHRIYLFETVYYHRTARAFELTLRDLLPRTLKRFMPGEFDLQQYKLLDDYTFVSKCLELASSEDPEERELGLNWRKALNERPIWKEIWVHSIEANVPPREAEDIERDLREQGFDMVRVDMPEIKAPENVTDFSRDKVAIYDPLINDIDVGSFKRLIDEIPSKISYYRFYVRKDTPQHTIQEAKNAISKLMRHTPLESSY